MVTLENPKRGPAILQARIGGGEVRNCGFRAKGSLKPFLRWISVVRSRICPNGREGRRGSLEFDFIRHAAQHGP